MNRILPVNLLVVIWIRDKFGMSPKVDGIDPDKRFELARNIVKYVNVKYGFLILLMNVL